MNCEWNSNSLSALQVQSSQRHPPTSRAALNNNNNNNNTMSKAATSPIRHETVTSVRSGLVGGCKAVVVMIVALIGLLPEGRDNKPVSPAGDNGWSLRWSRE
ncbi:hypothetical protein PAMA_016092 [Pampus argenteus]